MALDLGMFVGKGLGIFGSLKTIFIYFFMFAFLFGGLYFGILRKKLFPYEVDLYKRVGNRMCVADFSTARLKKDRKGALFTKLSKLKYGHEILPPIITTQGVPTVTGKMRYVFYEDAPGIWRQGTVKYDPTGVLEIEPLRMDMKSWASIQLDIEQNKFNMVSKMAKMAPAIVLGVSIAMFIFTMILSYNHQKEETQQINGLLNQQIAIYKETVTQRGRELQVSERMMNFLDGKDTQEVADTNQALDQYVQSVEGKVPG